ncbi:MAG: beta-ketoacyl-[acyl-carrier-protein] synthase II [Deltaproteobacteria bacterium]|nr:MAG: beta-ketoacyl-[acyl-carrier-protein] synthase II [Deltaproteobacteria bacterium]
MSEKKNLDLRRVVVTGMGMVNSMGFDVPTVWERLLAGQSGVHQVVNLSSYMDSFREKHPLPDDFPLIAGQIVDFDLKELLQARKKNPSKEDLKQIKYTDRFTQFALAASLEAVQDSGLDLEKEDPERAGVIIATGMGGVGSWEEQIIKLLNEGVRRVSPFLVPKMIPNLAAGNVSISFKAKGPNMALSTACAAGAHAIGMAYRSIQMGEADLMATGGTEAAITLLTMAGFYRMGALATGRNDNPEAASRPFDTGRNGFVMSEGSGVLVLEELEHALARGAKIHAEIIGFGMTGDAHHITDPHIEGAKRCIKLALKDAGIPPGEVDYVNPHATATPVGDKNEIRALQQIFEKVPRLPLVSGTKSMTGHLLGAAGAVEAIFTIMALKRGIVPPTINLDNPDPQCEGFDFVPNQPRKVKIRHALSNSFGFGGTNASLVFKAFEN